MLLGFQLSKSAGTILGLTSLSHIPEVTVLVARWCLENHFFICFAHILVVSDRRANLALVISSWLEVEVPLGLWKVRRQTEG